MIFRSAIESLFPSARVSGVSELEEQTEFLLSDAQMRVIVEIYHFEWTRLEKIRTRISFHTSIMLIYGGAIWYLLINYRSKFEESCLFLVLLFLVGVIYVAYGYYLFRAWHGFSFGILPTPNTVFEHAKQTYDHYLYLEKLRPEATSVDAIITARESAREKGDIDFALNLQKMRLDASQINHEANNKRDGFLHKARIANLLGAIFLMFLAFGYLLLTPKQTNNTPHSCTCTTRTAPCPNKTTPTTKASPKTNPHHLQNQNLWKSKSSVKAADKSPKMGKAMSDDQKSTEQAPKTKPAAPKPAPPKPDPMTIQSIPMEDQTPSHQQRWKMDSNDIVLPDSSKGD